MMIDSELDPRAGKRRLFLTLSMVSLAVSGLIAAVAVLFGGDSWNSIMTAALIFGLNVLVLISFAAAHSWLKIAQRVVAALAVFSSLFFLWVDVPYQWELEGKETPFLLLIRDWSMGSWIAVTTLSILCFLSICWRHLGDSRVLRVSYALSFSLGLGSTLVFWIVAGISSMDSRGAGLSPSLLLMGSALAILAATASLIVIVGSFVERAKSKSSTASVLAPVALPSASAELRKELEAMAQSGELLALLLQSPASVDSLRSIILPQDRRGNDGTKSMDNSV